MPTKIIKSIIFFTIAIIIALLSSYIYLIHKSNSHVSIIPVITRKSVGPGNQFNTDSIICDKPISVPKEDLNKYITSQNYKTFIGNYFFNHTINAGNDLTIQDITNNS